MKKILIFLFFILAVAGCKKDPLNITPDGRVSLQEIFADNYQTGAYLNACYSDIPSYGTSYYFWTCLAGFSDEAHDNDNPTESLPATTWYNGGLTTLSNPIDNTNSGATGGYYDEGWQGVRHCNVFLANIATANVTSPSDRAQWTAEAHALRAFYYLELIKRYGALPVETAPLSVTTDFSKETRGTYDADVQFIVADCKAAIAEPNLPWHITLEPDRGRMTKAIAYAIMSEATLFNASPLNNPTNDLKKWQQADSVSTAALTQLTANGFQLASDYYTYFISTPDLGNSPADKETIFQIKNSSGIAQIEYFSGIPEGGAYKAGDSPSQELVDSYEMANGQQPITGYSDANHLQPIINPASGYDDKNPYVNRDPRFYATVSYNGSLYGNVNGVPYYIQAYDGGSDGIKDATGALRDRHYTKNGYYIRKFIDPTTFSGQSGSASWKRFRLAEIYLNLAEAENEANGPTAAAYNAVNTVRARVNMPPLSGLTQDELRKRIRNERRVELAWEEARFYDVRRWKILNQTDLLTTGMEWTQTGNTMTNTRIVVDRRPITAEDKYLIFPIPASEMTDLPSFVQNPGW